MDLQQLLQGAQVRSLTRGEAVFAEGAASTDGFYFVVQGVAGVFRQDYEKGQKAIYEIKPGGTFGELGLLLRTPRTATIRAMEDGLKVVSLNEQFFLGAVKNFPNFLPGLMKATIQRVLALQENLAGQNVKMQWSLPAEILEVIKVNRQNNLLLREILENMPRLNLRPEQTLFAQGSSSDNNIYLVTSGRMGIYMEYADGSQALIGAWDPGDIFGYLHLVEEPVRKYTAKTLDQNCSLIYFDDDVFYKALRLYPVHAFSIYRTILSHLLAYQYNLLRARQKHQGLT